MRRSPREQKIHLLSIFFAAAPFAFGLIRAFRTGQDLRLLWMAFASFLGVSVVGAIGKRRGRTPTVVLAFTAIVFVIAVLLAGSTAFVLGATAASGIWGVALVFGFCWAASYALRAL